MTVALCFAFLQALQPFIHAHMDGEHHPHSAGIHTAEDHESAHALKHGIEHANSHEAVDASHAAHTISVSPGIKQDTTYALDDAITFILVAFCFALLLIVSPQSFPQSISNPISSLTRRLPAPRAPPSF